MYTTLTDVYEDWCGTFGFARLREVKISVGKIKISSAALKTVQ